MAKPGDAPRQSKKACCLVSGMLEEMGLDAKKAREVRRQTLMGLLTFCQWQLARIEEADAAERSRGPEEKTARRRARRVRVV